MLRRQTQEHLETGHRNNNGSRAALRKRGQPRGRGGGTAPMGGGRMAPWKQDSFFSGPCLASVGHALESGCLYSHVLHFLFKTLCSGNTAQFISCWFSYTTSRMKGRFKKNSVLLQWSQRRGVCSRQGPKRPGGP